MKRSLEVPKELFVRGASCAFSFPPHGEGDPATQIKQSGESRGPQVYGCFVRKGDKLASSFQRSLLSGENASTCIVLILLAEGRVLRVVGELALCLLVFGA